MPAPDPPVLLLVFFVSLIVALLWFEPSASAHRDTRTMTS
jgi:hypothetical protein